MADRAEEFELGVLVLIAIAKGLGALMNRHSPMTLQKLVALIMLLFIALKAQCRLIWDTIDIGV